MIIGQPVIGATAGSVLFVGAGAVLAEDTTNLTFNDATNALFCGGRVFSAALRLDGTDASNTIYKDTGNIGITVEAGNGVIVAGATTQGVGFYGSTPITQRAGAAQAAVATTGATNVAPWGYTTEAQANAIVTLVNELRAALVALNLIKGSA